MSIVSPPKGGSDVQDALISTQRKPNYSKRRQMDDGIRNNRVDNISQYVEKNLRNVSKPRHKEHR